MKKILTFALAALMIISMTGCAGNDNTQKEQEKVVTSFFQIYLILLICIPQMNWA